MQQDGSKYFARRPPPPPSEVQNSFFSEHGSYCISKGIANAAIWYQMQTEVQ